MKSVFYESNTDFKSLFLQSIRLIFNQKKHPFLEQK
mgnify:CR=1 FL=1